MNPSWNLYLFWRLAILVDSVYWDPGLLNNLIFASILLKIGHLIWKINFFYIYIKNAAVLSVSTSLLLHFIEN